MKPKIFNRAMIVVWMIFLPIAELGATGSYARMVGAFVALAAMVWFGWVERDNTMREVIEEVFDEAHKKSQKSLSPLAWSWGDDDDIQAGE